MKFLYGRVLERCPNGFVPPEAWPEYGTLADPIAFCQREYVGEHPRGMRWGFGPITFEQYLGDDEPSLVQNGGLLARRPRFVMWNRLRHDEVPPGWHQWGQKPWRIDGVFELVPGEDYTERWHKNARRDLRIWQKDFSETYPIGPATIEEFAAAYEKSLVAKRVDLERLRKLQRRFVLGLNEHIELWVVRSPQGKIVAGTAVIYSPSLKHSTHFSPFILEEGRSVFAATALINHWFARTAERGYRFVMTTNFWFPGQPRGWKGFSEFKSHFGFDYVAYKPPLWRLKGGKFF